MVRRAIPIVVLAAILGIAWLLLRQDAETSDDAAPWARKTAPPAAAPPAPIAPAPAPEATRLQGRPDKRPVVAPGPRRTVRRSDPTQPPPGLIRYVGTVRGEDGPALAGAEVYQALRRSDPSGRWRRPRHATTDAEGRFVLYARPGMDDVFGAQSHGYATTFVEGSVGSSSHEIHFVLPEAPRLTVRIVDSEGEPVAWGGVRVVPTERRGKYVPRPGPGWPRPEQYEMTNAEGVAVFSFDVPIPVMVIPEVDGLVTTPTEQWLPKAAGTVVFTASGGTTLILDVVDEKGTAVDGGVWAEIRDPSNAEVVMVVRGGPMASVVEEDLALPPGTYAVEISAPGCEPYVIPDLLFPGGGAEVKQSVVMRPLAEGAKLSIVPPEGVLTPALSPGTVALLARRTDGGWNALGWSALADVRLDREAGRITADFRPGTYDVLLTIDGEVASLGPVTFAEGATVTRRAHPKDGVTIHLYDVLPPDLAVRSLRIEVPGLGRLPVLGSTLRGRGSLLDSIDEAGSPVRRDPNRGAVLGPYPGSHVVLDVTDWRGTVHRFTATR